MKLSLNARARIVAESYLGTVSVCGPPGEATRNLDCLIFFTTTTSSLPKTQNQGNNHPRHPSIGKGISCFTHK
jgi:hypothetical protein